MNNSRIVSSIEDVLEDAHKGRMFILVDAEDRENEGDLVIPAQYCSGETVNFMTKHGRGLVCLALTAQRARKLKLRWMTKRNRARNRTAFTISIEAREGVSSGISAHDRAHTIAVAINPQKGASDLVSPGHMFPLVAKEGGVLSRAGHTEAAIDIARLAGLLPAGVLCEIVNEDGTMARMPDLERFAQTHQLRIATIADLIAYRHRRNNFMPREMEIDLSSRFGGQFHTIVFRNEYHGDEHVALINGTLCPEDPVIVRLHALNIFGDVLGSEGHRAGLLQRAMNLISQSSNAVPVLMRDTAQHAVSRAARARQNESDEVQNVSCSLRKYEIGAQIPRELGVRQIILLSDTKHEVAALEGYGLHIPERRSPGKQGGGKWL